MKLREIGGIIRDNLLWIVLFIGNTLLFIFLAWLAYPESFRVLLWIMVIIPLLSLGTGLLIRKRRFDKCRKTFDDFLREPGQERQQLLVEMCGDVYKDIIGEIGDKLGGLKDELTQTNSLALGYRDFIESWVHEIKTPLSLLTLVLENRKDEMSNAVFHKLEHVRADINDDIEKILYYARLHTYHSDSYLSRIDLYECFEEAAVEFESIFDEKGIILTEQIEGIPVVSDPKALRFIFSQILMNSVKYSSEDDNRWISVKTGKDNVNGRFYIKIADNGKGVHAADLPFIFDKAFSGRKSTGMGLYLVKRICDDLKIDISVLSESGKGFEITLLFPMT